MTGQIKRVTRLEASTNCATRVELLRMQPDLIGGSPESKTVKLHWSGGDITCWRAADESREAFLSRAEREGLGAAQAAEPGVHFLPPSVAFL